MRASAHNLSAAAAGSPTRTGTVPARTVQATSESQVCVFCHTPHGATAAAPLWNRKLSTATYTVYTSSSLDANVIQGTLDQPGGSSRLCLSCHDGTLAIGSVSVLDGQGSQTTPGTRSISMSGTAAGGVMPGGDGTSTGFTRNLGVDLRNDHPISVSCTAALANADGELRVPDARQRVGTTLGPRAAGFRPTLPLEPTGPGGTGQMQCATCHDPHLVESDSTKGNQKFLRAERFQTAQPLGAAFNAASDIICVGCHDKMGDAWAYSAHADQTMADESYLPAAASRRQFPAGIRVWQAACLNCHDTHAVQGAGRLLREATDGASVVVAGVTQSTDFPVLRPLQPRLAGPQDGFVTRLRADGSAVIYSTYLGGSGSDEIFAVALDAQGAAYVTGATLSPDFRLVSAMQARRVAEEDAFVARIAPDGASLGYSSYLGGDAMDIGYAVGVDARGYAYVVGETKSRDFPLREAVERGVLSCVCGSEMFLSEFDGEGRLARSHTVGGSGWSYGYGLALDGAGGAHVVGNTTAHDFPTRCAAQAFMNGSADAFVLKISPAAAATAVRPAACVGEAAPAGRSSAGPGPVSR